MFKIGSKLIGGGKVFVIAEIGINHNGSLDLAFELIDAAKSAGCDAVKFQKRTVPLVYKGVLDEPRKVDSSIIKNALNRAKIEDVDYEVLPLDSQRRLKENFDNTTNGDLKYALEFGLKEYDLIDRYCQKLGIYWSASSWDGLSAHFINGYNVMWHKIASPCLTNIDLLHRVRANGKPMIISTGGCDLHQIHLAVDIIGIENLTILHCVSVYPTPDDKANIGVIKSLRDEFPYVPIGYSGHEIDDLASLVAVRNGACIVERHITLDKNMPGSDHKVSLEPDEFKNMVSKIRRLEDKPLDFLGIIGKENSERVRIINGDGVKRILSSEIEIMEKLRRVNDLK